MSEQDRLQHHVPEDAAGFSQEQGEYLPSPGALLRQGREAAGVHLAGLAASLKVSVEKIEALEQDQFHLLPDAVFARALAGSVCRMLKLDPAPILDRLPAIHTAKPAPQNRGINESFRTREVGLTGSVWNSISRPAVLAGIVLLLGALILVFLPTLRQHEIFPASASTDVGADEGVALALPALLNGTAVDANTDAVPLGVQPVATVASTSVSADNAQALPALVSKPAPSVAPALASVATLPATAVGASSADSSAGLAFRATGPSWIKVIDAKGIVVLNRTLQAGEVADVTGAFPFAVTVGRTDVTQVQVRGQAFDLAAVSKNNIARFEVK